jgi:GTPase
MENNERTELSVQRERAFLVGVILPDSKADPMDPLGELRSLAKTAGANVVDEITANRAKPTPGLYLGTGKAQEIADRALMNQVDVVIFDNDLSPAQIRDLEKIIGRKVIDRSELILDIFACHAQTHASRLQVELAQLEYTYPRLRHMWSHLERVAGGATSAASAVGAIGTRGPGEKQLEIDRRLVQKRVALLKRQIEDIDRRKVREVRSRKDAYNACLVGYTNAGKSTMMKLMTGAEVFIADQLFATLDTKTRRWNIGNRQEVLLSDTVGFVRDLPPHLVASFRATLEEAIWADLLIHVADASHDRVEQQIQAVEEVLDTLECPRDRRLLVLNKVDRIIDPLTRSILARKYPEALFVSAVTGEGADGLIGYVAHRAAGTQLRIVLKANCRNGRLMQFLAHHAKVERQTYEDSTMRLEGTISENHMAELLSFGADVEILVPAQT